MNFARKFNHKNIWYMLKPEFLQDKKAHKIRRIIIIMLNLESVLENEIHKLLRDFEIKTDHQILARRPDLIIINKKRELGKLWALLSQRTIE